MLGKNALKLTFILLMIIIYPIFAETAVLSSDSKETITLLGAFSNMRFTEEHQQGFDILLWQRKEDGRIFGYFGYADGLIGDKLNSLIENVIFDPKARSLSFEAKLSMGESYCKKEHKIMPSRNLFIFRGKLKDNSLSGKITELDALNGHRFVSETKVNLKNIKGKIAEDVMPKTYGEWETWINKILRFGGPKW